MDKLLSPEVSTEKIVTLKLDEGHAQALTAIMHCIVHREFDDICEYELEFSHELLEELKNHNLLV